MLLEVVCRMRIQTYDWYISVNHWFLFQATLGMIIQHPAFLCPDLNRELLEVAKSIDCQSVLGKTMCTYDFYEGKSL